MILVWGIRTGECGLLAPNKSWRFLSFNEQWVDQIALLQIRIYFWISLDYTRKMLAGSRQWTLKFCPCENRRVTGVQSLLCTIWGRSFIPIPIRLKIQYNMCTCHRMWSLKASKRSLQVNQQSTTFFMITNAQMRNYFLVVSMHCRTYTLSLHLNNIEHWGDWFSLSTVAQTSLLGFQEP